MIAFLKNPIEEIIENRSEKIGTQIEFIEVCPRYTSEQFVYWIIEFTAKLAI
jgi:hypothetical protein